MKSLSKLIAVAGVLGVGTEATAGGWNGYLSVGAGVALDHLSDFHAKGPALYGYLGAEMPVGLSLGLLAEMSETWGEEFPSAEDMGQLRHSQLDYKAVGIEARMRFFRDKPINPWIGARLSKSWSSPFTPDDFGELRRKNIDTTSVAFRVGIDGWFGDHWGISLASAFQVCDVKVPEDIANKCAKPLQTVILGPVLKF